MEQDKSHKEIATSFLEMVTEGKIHEAYTLYVSHEMKHHNVYFAGDAKSLEEAMIENHTQFPQKQLSLQHILEDADLVAVHSRVRLSLDKSEMALVHIFRFEENKIIEIWDIGQEVPKEMPNENGMF